VEQRKIWSHFQNRRPEAFSQAESRHRFLLSRLPKGRVLNIGIGDGGFERLASASSREVHSVDPDRETAARAARLGISHAVVGSIDALPFSDGCFEVVVCSEVLEHLSDDVLLRGLAEIGRVLRSGGELHGTVPADENLGASEVVCPCCGTIFHRWGHMQSFAHERLREVFRPLGPARIERRVFMHWPSLNWKGRISASLRLALATFGKPGRDHNFYFVVTKNG
jgi:SAM-dependent methyltransferase